MSCRGTIGERKGGWGEERGQFNANLGWEWTRIAPQFKKGISKLVQKGNGRESSKKGARGNMCRHLLLHINKTETLLVYMLIKNCV